MIDISFFIFFVFGGSWTKGEDAYFSGQDTPGVPPLVVCWETSAIPRGSFLFLFDFSFSLKLQTSPLCC